MNHDAVRSAVDYGNMQQGELLLSARIRKVPFKEVLPKFRLMKTAVISQVKRRRGWGFNAVCTSPKTSAKWLN